MDYRELYERVWTHDGYRFYSPAEQLEDVLTGAFQPASRVVDFGCGTGRMAAKLKVAGCRVIGIDVAGNCLDKGINIPFLRCDLTKLPANMLAADYGYCVDVLEHLTTDDLTKAVRSMRDIVQQRLYIRVANFRENHGIQYVNEQLHLTLWNEEQWQRFLEAVWCETALTGSVQLLPLKADISPTRYTFVLSH